MIQKTKLWQIQKLRIKFKKLLELWQGFLLRMKFGFECTFAP